MFDFDEDYEKEERFKDSAEDFFCRASAMLRAIYYSYKDMELTGKTNHESLERNVNSLLYNVFKAEEDIKAKSEDEPIIRPPIHGLAKEYNEQLIESLNRTYKVLRNAAKTRAEKQYEKEQRIKARKNDRKNDRKRNTP